MITARIKIGTGTIVDTYEKYGMIYLSSDNRTEAPIKQRETTSYAEEAGEHTDPRTLSAAFDYKVKFLIEAPNENLVNANAKIATFNKALYSTQRDSDIRIFHEITFYNDYKRVKIVGIPLPIAEPEKFYRRQDGSSLDCVIVDFTIRVSDPTKCDFNLNV